MRIQHNIMAMNAYRNYNKNTSALAKNLEKLSSGYKINRAGDDAAGLAISEKMRAQITGLEAAQKNVKDGISLVNTAEGAMQEIQDMMNRMVYLATESANGTFDNEVDRKNLQDEVNQLREEIDRIAKSANFNGIKLLDGSLDAESTSKISAGSAIQNLTFNDYKATGPSAAFEANYITNRPEAATYQTNAKFSVSFDDVVLTQQGTAAITFDVTIGGKTLSVTLGSSVTEADGSDIAAALVKWGATSTLAAQGSGTTNGVGKTTDAGTAEEWKAAASQVTSSTANAHFLEIDGHWYKMEVDGTNGNTLNFTQVDWMGTSGGTEIHPDFDVEVRAKNAGSTGTLNWKVQETTKGVGIGASHQAQVDVDIDFSKLKDGDVLTVGEKNYVFKVGANSTTTAATGQTLIDLSAIFKTEADLADAKKQADAMVKIVGDMGGAGSTTWSAGNGGVVDGKGKLTFQSLSSYVDDATAIGSSAAAGAPTCNMKTEASVMKQFYSNSKEAAANVTFELDVTKIKEGDTITIDGVTFEFTDGPNATGGKNNIAIDLSTLGLANGGTIPDYNTADVIDKLKTAINNNLNYGSGAANTKYNISVDGNKVTLTSNDNANSADVKENRVLADVKLSQNSYEGSALTLQIGDTSDDFNQLEVSIKDMHCESLGIDGIDIGSAAGAKAAINVIKDAINEVSSVRGKLGALSNRLDHTANNLSVMRENIQDAESAIRDTDVAEEMMKYTKNNILVQSAQAMLAQANQVPQGVLQLLQ